MAVSVVILRPRARGTEIVINDDGTDRTLWRRDWWPHDNVRTWAELTGAEKTDLLDWGTPVLVNLRAAEQVIADEDAADDAVLDVQAFFTWLYQHRANPRIRNLLKPAAQFYRDEVA